MTAGILHRAGRSLGRAVHALVPADRIEKVALAPAVTRAGYIAATGLALLWGSVLSGFQVSLRGGVIVCQGLPRWAFGRGGTTVGAVYLTRDAVNDRVLAHEAVHHAQWRRYGLALIPLYIAAGRDPQRNRFEIEAGLDAGGYR